MHLKDPYKNNQIRNAFSNKEECKALPIATVMDIIGVGSHPSECPAFRVRRGRCSPCPDMTRYDGSRASGYPPDLHTFSAVWGLPTAAAVEAWAHSPAALPSGSLGETRAGKPCKSGGRGRMGLTEPAWRNRCPTESNARRARPCNRRLRCRRSSLRIVLG
jgi:hypothetical protein